MFILKLFNVWDSFEKEWDVCHFLDLGKRVLSIPCPVVFGFGANIVLSLQWVYGVSLSTKI